MEPIRVSAVQMESALGDARENAERIIEWMQNARAEDARLACFPEACLTGYSALHANEAAVTRDDPAIAAILDAACGFRIAVSFGFIEKSTNGRLYVAHLVFDGAEGGGPPLVYRKTHLGNSERAIFFHGDELPVARIAGAVVGVQLCWESHFPDISTTLRAKGAELLLVPYASPLGGMRRRETWNRYLPARAYDNGAFVVAANALSRDSEGATRGGGVAAYNPDGSVIADSYQATPGMITCDLVHKLPRNIPQTGMKNASFFDARRPDLYAIQQSRS